MKSEGPGPKFVSAGATLGPCIPASGGSGKGGGAVGSEMFGRSLGSDPGGYWVGALGEVAGVGVTAVEVEVADSPGSTDFSSGLRSSVPRPHPRAQSNARMQGRELILPGTVTADPDEDKAPKNCARLVRSTQECHCLVWSLAVTVVSVHHAGDVSALPHPPLAQAGEQ